MKLALSTLNRDNSIYKEISDTLEYLKGFGTKYVDISAADSWQNHISPSDLSDTDYERNTYNTIIESGLIVDAFNANFKYQVTTSDKQEFGENLRVYEDLCKFAKRLNVRSITLGPGYLEDRTMVYHNMEMLKVNMPYLADISKEYGVLLSLECHQASTLEHTAEIEKAMSWLFPSVGLTLDPSHPVMQDIPLSDLEDFVKYTYMAHIRSASLGKMQDTLENNQVDFEKYIAMLHKGGYTDSLSIEFFSNFDEGRILKPFVDLMLSMGLEF